MLNFCQGVYGIFPSRGSEIYRVSCLFYLKKKNFYMENKGIIRFLTVRWGGGGTNLLSLISSSRHRIRACVWRGGCPRHWSISFVLPEVRLVIFEELRLNFGRCFPVGLFFGIGFLHALR